MSGQPSHRSEFIKESKLKGLSYSPRFLNISDTAEISFDVFSIKVVGFYVLNIPEYFSMFLVAPTTHVFLQETLLSLSGVYAQLGLCEFGNTPGEVC